MKFRFDGDNAPLGTGETENASDAAALASGDGIPLPAEDRAVIQSVETDPKQPGMYRLTMQWPGRQDEAHFTVHEDTLVSMRLLKGRRLNREEWECLLKEEALEEAYRAALLMLQRKERTGRELEEALKRKGFSQEAIRGAIRRLKARGLVDDAAYARRFAEQRVAWHRKGSRLVRQELLRRGVSKAEADQALEQMDREAEREAAIALARRKWPQLKGTWRERKMKLTAFLLRRGFPGKLAKAAAEQAAAEAGASQGDPEAE